MPAYKIASYEITDIPLIRQCARTMKPVILATGVAHKEEIEAAVGNDPFALRGLAKHAIVEFRPSRVADDSLAKLFGD